MLETPTLNDAVTAGPVSQAMAEFAARLTAAQSATAASARSESSAIRSK